MQLYQPMSKMVSHGWMVGTFDPCFFKGGSKGILCKWSAMIFELKVFNSFSPRKLESADMRCMWGVGGVVICSSLFLVMPKKNM